MLPTTTRFSLTGMLCFSINFVCTSLAMASCNLVRVVGSVVNWKSGYFCTSSRTNVRNASFTLL